MEKMCSKLSSHKWLQVKRRFVVPPRFCGGKVVPQAPKGEKPRQRLIKLNV